MKIQASLMLRVIIILCLMITFSYSAVMAKAQQADLPGKVDQDAINAARQYLEGYADGDKILLRNLMAKELENFYGPCLFAAMPKLSNTRVDGARAMVDFNGQPSDPALPREGTIVMQNIDLDGHGRKWHIRAIFWKNNASISAREVTQSRDPKDKAKIPQVQAVATQYINSWLKEDWKTMNKLTYDWLSKERPLSKEVYIRDMKFDGALRPDGSVRVEFTITASPRAKMIKFIKKTGTGMMYVVKEDDTWKVRGITASL